MRILKRKTHQYDPYFYGIVIAKSTSLLLYINSHPEGKDYARRRVIEAKYNISKIHPVLYGLYKRAINEYSDYFINKDMFISVGGKSNFYDGYIIKSITQPYVNFCYQSYNDEISISNEQFILTKDKLNSSIFVSVYNAISVRKKNDSEIDFNIKTKDAINKYSKIFTSEYP